MDLDNILVSQDPQPSSTSDRMSDPFFATILQNVAESQNQSENDFDLFASISSH